MSALGLIGFNFLINGMLSFGLALLVVYAVLRGFRIGPGFTRRALLLLPLLKLGWDWSVGIPEQSFLWAKLHGASQELGTFMLGYAWPQAAPPRVAFRIGAMSGGDHFPQSGGDLLHAGLSKKVAPWLPDALLGAVLLVCALRLAWRLCTWLRVALREQRQRRGAWLLETRRVGWRSVPIYVSEAQQGAPFTTGTLSACVVIPAATYASLSPPLRAAAIEHELAHVRYFDPARLIALSLVSDLLWFLPGLSGLLARMRAEMELRADHGAVTRGADPEALAAALVRVAQHVSGACTAAPGASSALFAKGRVLTARVTRLLGAETLLPPRFGCRSQLGRMIVLAFVYGTVLTAVFLGNAPPP